MRYESKEFFYNFVLPHFSQIPAAGVEPSAAPSSTESRCPMCSEQNWHQLDQEMWRMERWLEYSTATLNAFQDVEPPTTIERLEDAIQVRLEPIHFLSFHFFKKKWAIPAPFCLFLSFQPNIKLFYNKCMGKNVHPVYCAGIRTHNLQFMSLLP